MRATVLGAGSWGTALGAHLAAAGHDVLLWGRDADLVREIGARRENLRYLPGARLPERLQVVPSFAEALAGAELVVLAVPSERIGEIAALAARVLPGVRPSVVCASKGLEADSGRTMDAVIDEAWPGAQAVLLSGPTFAAEIVRGLPAAAVAASRDAGAAAQAQAAFSTSLFRVYTSDDVIGVGLGGALKNVIAIAAGAVDGLGFGANARAALITRGLAEVGRLAVSLGGHPLTLAGLAGMGDLVLTCTGELSRNRRVGLALAGGGTLAEALAGLGQVAEGVPTAKTARMLADRHGVDMPITRAVASVLHDGATPGEALAKLMAREPRAERV